jgi:hypothetical protein
MNYNELSRPLEISDVDFRVQSINNGGYATILAYKDARVDMNRLDEVLTPIGWQRDYKLIDNKLFCGVGIWHEESNQWIWKWDVGTESNTEAEKGQASDAFKRACFNLGIGRELYDYPIISVKLLDNEWTKDGGKPRQTYELKIKDWKWYSEFTDGKITFLAAKDQNGNVRFKWGQMKPKTEEPTYKPASGGTPEATEERAAEPLSSPKAVEPNPVDEAREAAIMEYEAVFGKKPHHKSSTEKIIQDVKAEAERIMSEQMQEDEEPMVEDDYIEEVANSKPSILGEIGNIQSFKDPASFVAWAKKVVGEWMEKDTKENIDTFKDLCNDHYSKMVK